MAKVAEVTTGLKVSTLKKKTGSTLMYTVVQGQDSGSSCFAVILWAVVVMTTFACRCGT